MYDINMDTITLDSNPTLRAPNELVALPLSPEDAKTLQKMVQYVADSCVPELAEKYNLQPAVGIAAPQIGINKHMTAIIVHDEDETHQFALVNPKIISHSTVKCALGGGEGCLSVRDPHPGYVPRYQQIRVQAFDYLQNKDIDITVSGFLAIVLQHEIDHLHGILFYDRIDKVNPWNSDNLQIID